MKAAAIFMVIILVVSVCGVGYLYMTSSVTVAAVGMVATEATAQQGTFDELKVKLAAGSATGTIYQAGETLGDADDYQFYTYTVRLKNNCLLNCDMVELQVTPRDGDIIQLRNEQTLALATHTTGDISATILTVLDSGTARELLITYYVWGIPFTIKTIYG